MPEKRFKYAAKFKQPQTVGGVRLNPNGGYLSERDYKAVKKDAYGASLLEKGLLVVEECRSPANDGTDEGIPDFGAPEEGGG